MSLNKLVTLVLLSSILTSGCKKGEDDPFLSLRTRKARVVGNWHVSSGNAELSASEAGKLPYTERYLIKADQIKLTASYYTASVTSNYGLTINLKKDGTAELTETVGARVVQGTGTWDFGSGVGAGKSKTTLVLRISDFSSGTNYNSLFCSLRTVCIYHIRELRDKKMVVECTDDLELDADGYGTKFYSSFTLVQ